MPGVDHQPRAATGRNAQVVVAVILVGAAMGWGAGILTPLALAVFLMVMIDSLARRLAQRISFVSQRTALPAAVVLSALVFILVVLVMAENAGRFAGQLFAFGVKLDVAMAKLAAMVGAKAPTLGDLVGRLNPTSYLGAVIQAVQGFSTKAALVTIYLGFLLASRQGFARKANSLFRTEQGRQSAARLFVRIRDSIERYLWVQTVACASIALASWGVMAIFGLNDAAFWAFAIFTLGYIPIIGGAIGVLAPPLFALIQFDGWWPAAVMLTALSAINLFVGNVVYPRMQGKSLNIDPVVLLLALAFWGAIWGVSGMFLSTPLTVMAMAILAQFDGARWIAILLSSDGDPLGEASAPAAEPEAIDHAAVTKA